MRANEALRQHVEKIFGVGSQPELINGKIWAHLGPQAELQPVWRSPSEGFGKTLTPASQFRVAKQITKHNRESLGPGGFWEVRGEKRWIGIIEAFGEKARP